MASYPNFTVLPPPRLYHPCRPLGECTVSGGSSRNNSFATHVLIFVKALGLALLGVALTIQAYVSTGLKPEEVLVWMPLPLVLDAGAME